MSGTVIDALMITLGLDASDYEKKRKEVIEGFKESREDASKTAKEMEVQGKKAASFFSGIKNELLALVGVSLTFGGVTSLVKNTTSDLQQLSVQSKALGMSARELDGWSRSAEAVGSSAGKISQTLFNIRDAALALNSGDASNPLYGVMAMLSGDTGVTFDPTRDSADEMMRKFSEALQKEYNPDRAQYIGNKITGNDAALYQAMRSGELPKLATQYKNSSQITNESLTAAAEFTKAWTDLGQNFDNLKNKLYTSLIPTIRTLNGLIKEWSKNASDSSPFWKSFKQDIKDITGTDLGQWTLADDIKNLMSNFKQLGSTIDHLVNALNALNNGDFVTAGSEFKKAWHGTEDGKPSGKDALPGITKSAADARKDSVYEKLNDTLNYYLPSFLGGMSDEAKGQIQSSLQKNAGSEGLIPDSSAGYLSPQQQATRAMLDSARFTPSPEQRKQQQDERSYWETSKTLLSTIASALVPSANADVGYQPNVPLNPLSAKLGEKGKALLGAMSGEFGQLEAKYGLPVGVLNAIASVESGGNPQAESKAGAKGLFQLMPGTAKDLGLSGDDVFNPSKSAEAGAKYLRWLMDQTGGDIESALAAYNWGIGNVKNKGLPNAPLETRNYVPAVMSGFRPGAGMAVDNVREQPHGGAAGNQYYISDVKLNSSPQSVDRLATDIASKAENRVRVIAFNSGQSN